MSKEGTRLAALFSYNCPRSKKLGIDQILLEFIRKGVNQGLVEKELQRLVSYGYYQLIAPRIGVEDVLNERVVKAYWIGDDELESKLVIKTDTGPLFLFHNFTVLGAIHRKPDADPDNCKISIGRVKETEGDSIIVYHKTLILKDNEFSLAAKSEVKEIEKGFIKRTPEREEWVAYHWGIARGVLREEEAISLYRRTERAIKLFNEAQSSSK